jgi:urease accessory protein
MTAVLSPALPFPSAAPAPRPVTAMQRAVGVARLGVRADAGTTRLVENYQSGSAKLRFPRTEPGEPFTAVFINTAGGITGGDRFSVSVSAGQDARVTVTSQAAERIYRRSSGHAGVETRLSVAAGATLDWVPQETILFDRSALRRTLDADVAGSGRLLAAEAIVLGRTAMGEAVREVTLTDSWRIRRDGRPVFADGLRLDGDSTAILAGGATGNGALALATVVFVASDAEAALDVARAALADAASEAGASAWNGTLVARLIAGDARALRTDLIRLLETLRGHALPRVWNC